MNVRCVKFATAPTGTPFDVDWVFLPDEDVMWDFAVHVMKHMMREPREDWMAAAWVQEDGALLYRAMTGSITIEQVLTPAQWRRSTEAEYLRRLAELAAPDNDALDVALTEYVGSIIAAEDVENV